MTHLISEHWNSCQESSYLSWWTESLVWMMPPAWQPYYCYNPMAQNRRICSRECVHSNPTTKGHLLPKLTPSFAAGPWGSPHPKGVQDSPFEGIDQPDEAAVGGDQDQFPIVAELQPCPLTGSVILHLKRGKGPLQTAKGKCQEDYALLLTGICF